MATETLPGPLGEVRAASTASGGTALTTTAARIVLPRGTKYIALLPRNFATAVVVKFNKNPYLKILKTTDLLATQANLTDYSEQAQDGDAGTDVTLSSLDTLANLDAVYVGAVVPFSGLQVDIDAANGTAATILVEYWNGTAWADISATDGTTSGGATFAIDGNITWTVPSAWATTSLDVAQAATAGKNIGALKHDFYWVRISVSAALDSSTTANNIIAINRDTTYAEIPVGMWWEESVTVGPGGFYSITALTDAGTANLIVNCATRQPGRF
jgi:hypothetical protein